MGNGDRSRADGAGEDFLAGWHRFPGHASVAEKLVAEREEFFERAEAVVPPSIEEAPALAAKGRTNECVEALRQMVRATGPSDSVAAPLDALLDGVKNDLKAVATPSPKVVRAANTCELVLNALPNLLPVDSPKAAELGAKAHNRRGDALLLLGRPQEALAEFAAAADPNLDMPKARKLAEQALAELK